MADGDAKSLHDTTGIILVAVLINAVLYGAVSLQSYAFYSRGKKDGWILRYFVALLWILDTLQLLTCCHAIYFWLISHYGEPEYLPRLTWSTNVQIGLTVGTCFLVRCFYAYRVWRMSRKNKFVTLPIIIFNLGCLGLGLGLSAYTFVLQRFDQLHRYGIPTTLQLACATAGDTSIALAMVYYLQNGKSGLPRTNSLINKLILWSVSTGLLTAVVEFLAMITWITLPKTLVYGALELVLGKLYTNSMLAMLNSRPVHPNTQYQSSTASGPLDAYTTPELVFRPVLRTTTRGSESRARTAHDPSIVIDFGKAGTDAESAVDTTADDAPSPASHVAWKLAAQSPGPNERPWTGMTCSD